MLVLTRKPGESIVIGPDIRIDVVAVNRKRVRIGVKAPSELIIDRLEVSIRRRDGPRKD